MDILEVLLQSGPGLLRSLTLNDRLVLIRDNFGNYACYFAHSLIILFFLMHHSVHENVWCELNRRESFLYELFSNGFNQRLFSSFNDLFASLLAKFAYSMGLPSRMVR